MLQPRRGLLWPLAITWITLACVTCGLVEGPGLAASQPDRGNYEEDGVNTVLVLDNNGRNGRLLATAVPVVTSTARTFVQEGTTTEYATHVIGTRLDKGKLYASVVGTSSRVYYDHNLPRFSIDNQILPSVPWLARPTAHIVYPAKEPKVPFKSFKPSVVLQTAVIDDHLSFTSKEDSLQKPINGGIKAQDTINKIPNINARNLAEEKQKDAVNDVENNLLVSPKQELFNQKRNVAEQQVTPTIRPTQVVKPGWSLPTFTIKHDFAPSGFSADVEDEETTEGKSKDRLALRGGKALFRHGIKADNRKLDTVTYRGFADFTTTVGDTVIIFMPNTIKHEPSRLIESFKASSIVPSEDFTIVSTMKTFYSHTPGMQTKTVTGHSLSMQTTLPTHVVLPETKSRRIKTFPLDDPVHFVDAIPDEVNDRSKPSVPVPHEHIEGGHDVKTSSPIIEPSLPVEETLSSSIKSTPQVLPSEVGTRTTFFPDHTEPLATFATTRTQILAAADQKQPLGLVKVLGGTRAYNDTTTLFTSLIYGTIVDGTYTQIVHSTSSVFYFVENTSTPSVASPEPETTTESEDALTITENFPTTDLEDINTTPVQATTPEIELSNNEIERGRKIKTPPNDQIIVDNKLESGPEISSSNSSHSMMIDALNMNGYTTKLIPSTVYKTFTYLTTFFIPDGASTTTSVRSREVTSSEIKTVTKVINGNAEQSITVALHSSSVQENLMTKPATFDQETTSERDSFATTIQDEKTTEHSPEVGKTTLDLETDKTTTDKMMEDQPMTTENILREEQITTTESEEITITSPAPITTSPENEEEEIDLIFKTLYTTYTYLTTFFQESTTSVSSREVVVTNIVTSTLDREFLASASDPAVAGLFGRDESIVSSEIIPTSIGVGRPTTQYFSNPVGLEEESLKNINKEERVPSSPVKLEPSSLSEGLIKTYYTTYTYFTTIFVDGETSISSRTEIYTNIVTPSVMHSTPVLTTPQPSRPVSSFTSYSDQVEAPQIQVAVSKSYPQNEALFTRTPSLKSTPHYAYSSTISRSSLRHSLDISIPSDLHISTSLDIEDNNRILPQKTPILKDNYATISRPHNPNSSAEALVKTLQSSITPSSLFSTSTNGEVGNSEQELHFDEQNMDMKSAILAQEQGGVLHSPVLDVPVSESQVNLPVSSLLESSISIIDEVAAPQASPIIQVRQDTVANGDAVEPSSISEEPVSVKTMSMITDVTSSSSGGNLQNDVLEDQISSESNTEEIEPSPTLLLQTSYTTFTYFTTVYKGTSSFDIISRLETVTNVVTETLSPTRSSIVEEEATLPVTYFTTFTYWTTLYKDGSTVVTSREETVSNIITPSVTLPPVLVTATPVPGKETTKAEATTYYTTYTYFTTSYIGNSTVLNSRLETVTNVVNETDDQTGRAIGTTAPEQLIVDQVTKTEGLNSLATGLLSTILTSDINDGTTTLFSTDVYGTYIDGLYAKILESSTQVLTPTASTTQSETLLPTGVVSLNEGRIVDADGVSTTYYTTKAIGTYIEQLYAQVIESTSSIKVDEDKKSLLPTESVTNKNFKTGLVRLIEGSIVKDHTTTFYESKVVGTVIDGRYAQIIESTSSFKVGMTSTQMVEPSIVATSVTTLEQTTASINLPSTTPSSTVIESSIGDDGSEEEEEIDDEDEDEEDDDDDSEGGSKKSKKSRLRFSTRKRTFTPVIRPFASRNRPTFNPRRKTGAASSATTITRTTLTPTITATPVAKNQESRGRFASNRRQSSSLNEIRPASPSSSRRFSRVRSTPGYSSGTYSTQSGNRGRSSSRIYPSATSSLAGSSRRGGYYRGSSSRGGASDSVLRSSIGGSNSRFRIRPTSSLFGKGASTAFAQSTTEVSLNQEDNDITTLVTEDTPAYTDEEQDSPTQPISTTTESTRRTNPLLRFRRPPGLRVQATTPKPATTTSPRRNPTPRRGSDNNNNRLTTTTVKPKTTPSFTNRFKNLNNRPRPSNSLFPKRGLFKKPDEEEKQPEKTEEDILEKEESDDLIGDNDYEGSEVAEAKTETTGRKSKSLTPQIKPFVGFQRRRSKRQTSEFGARREGTGRSNYNPRFRRPTSGRTPAPAQERSDSIEEEPVQETPKGKTSNRFTPRARATSAAAQQKIRPTSASAISSRSPFTLREKDTTQRSFRRPSPARRRPAAVKETTVQRAKAPRLRTNANTQTETTQFTRPTSRRYTNANGNSRRTTSRSRSRGDTTNFDSFTYSPSSFDGTITVTHRVPTEVTIPIVNGKITEYRNVITASPSTEVLGPHQYTSIAGKDGSTVLLLTSEATGTLANGLTEVTQYILHETPTTSITFTPTVIRGRKTSFSHIVPSTVYEVEQLVSTIQPQLSPNAPLANILLSQLLLGNLNLNQPNLNPLLGLNQPTTVATPTTEFKTRATTYVTTVTKGTSTVLPLTFRGKEILTTIVDTSLETITATEFITDTIVITPTAAGTANQQQLNSLLLPALLQAQLFGQNQATSTTVNPLFALQQLQDPKTEDILDIEDITHVSQKRRKPEDPDRQVRDSEKENVEEEIASEVEEPAVPRFKSSRKKPARNPFAEKKPPEPVPSSPATSVVTLFVSGRRPGEFSTVLSTVVVDDDNSAGIKKREAGLFKLEASILPEFNNNFDQGYLENSIAFSTNDVLIESSQTETQSLESIVGDVSKYILKDHLTSKLDDSLITSMTNSIEKSPINDKITGHFLSKGPAEFAPLKRKVESNTNRGLKSDMESIPSGSVSLFNDIISGSSNVDEMAALSRPKRNAQNLENGETVDSPQPKRRRVRVRVPVNRHIHDTQNEMLDLSEAQQNQQLTDMEILTPHSSNEQTDGFGHRKVKVVRAGTKSTNFDDTQDIPKKRIVIRRRKPHNQESQHNSDSEDAQQIDHVKELELEREKSLQNENFYNPLKSVHPYQDQLSSSPHRRKVVVTRKRPISTSALAQPSSVLTPTSSPHRRRIVVTKKRPATKTLDVFPTESLHTINSLLPSLDSNSNDKNEQKVVDSSQDETSQRALSGIQSKFNETFEENRMKDMHDKKPLSNVHIGSKLTDIEKEIEKELEMNTEKIVIPSSSLLLQPTQVEPSFDDHELSLALQTATQTLDSLMQNQTLEIDSSRVLSTLSLENINISKEIPNDQLEKSTVETEHMHHMEDIGKQTTNETLISSTEEGGITEETSDYEGPPRFVRPTRFSITKKPSRTKASFLAGRRKTSPSALQSSSSTGAYNGKSSSSKTGYHASTTKPNSRYKTFDVKSTSTFKSQHSTRGFRPQKAFGQSSSLHKKTDETVKASTTVVDSTSDFDINSKLEMTISPIETETLADTVTPILDTLRVEDVNTLPSPTNLLETATGSYTTIVVTSTRLRTFTFVVTRVSGDEQVVTSSTEVKPHVTTVTLTQSLPDPGIQTTSARDDRVLNIAEPRFNLATKVMSNGVEVIVAGDKSTLPGEPEILRVLSTPSRPVTLAPSTLTDHMMMFLPQAASQADLSSSLHGNEFVTKTYLTTYTYLHTSVEDGTTDVSKQEHTVSNVVTEERLSSTPALSHSVTLTTSPSLATATFFTTYTYFNTMLDGDIPIVMTSTRTISNTITGPPSELTVTPQEETNIYLSTLDFTKTVTEGDKPQVLSTQNVLTQKVITQAALQTSSVDKSPPAVSTTDIVKTYFVTYTYLNTYLESGSTVVSSDVSISTDIATEKFYISPKRTSSITSTSSTESSPAVATEKTTPFYLYATKTYLTTFTYFTTLLQEGSDHKTSTLVSSHTSVVQNIVTESISPELFGSEVISSLRESMHSGSIVTTATLPDGNKMKVTAMEEIQPTSTSTQSVTATAAPELISSENGDTSLSSNNVVTGSTIIFFDENDQIDSQPPANQATPALEISSVQTLSVQTLLHPEGGQNQGTIDAQPLTSQSVQLDSILETSPGAVENNQASSTISYTESPQADTPPSGESTQPSSNVTVHSASDPQNKRPNGGSFGPGGSEIQVSDLLSLGSLGINGLNALGPVINAMAGLIHSNIHDHTRRNDTITSVRPGFSYVDEKGNPRPVFVSQGDRTTSRSPIYIPVGGLAEDVETAESVNHESWGESQARHPNLASAAALSRQPIDSPLLSDGIAISPGQVITANSDVIVGKHGVLGPRPPKIHSEKEIPVGMRPPPPPRQNRPATDDYLGPPPIPDQVGHPSIKDHVGGPPPQRIRDHISTHLPVRNHNSVQGGKIRDHIGNGHPIRTHQLTSPNKNYLLNRLPPKDHRVEADLHPPPLPIELFHPPQQVGADIIVHPPILNENHFISNNPNTQEIGQFPVSSGVQAVFGQQKPNDIIHGKMPAGSHILDSSAGEPLLVNIQPSQVANVVIKDGSSTAYSFEGGEYVDRSPFPVPENGPSFVGLDNINVDHVHNKGYSGSVSSNHHTRMDPPPLSEAESVNINVSPQGINVAPQGINVDITPGQGINVDVSPGVGVKVDLSGHVHGNEHISPSGIVLDAPLNERPTPNEILLHGRPTDVTFARPVISHINTQNTRKPHRPPQGNGSPGKRIPIPHHHFPQNQQRPNLVNNHHSHGSNQPPKNVFYNGNQGMHTNSHSQSQTPNKIFHNINQGQSHNTHGPVQATNHVQHGSNQKPNYIPHRPTQASNHPSHIKHQSSNHGSLGENYPQRPIDFMVPPPPPPQKYFNNEPKIIPLHTDGQHDDRDEDLYDSEDGELTQASNSRPVKPGQYPSEVNSSGSRKPPTRPNINTEAPEILIKPSQLPTSNINVHQQFDKRPSKPQNTHSSFDVLVQPQGNYGRPQIFDESHKLPSKVWPKQPQFEEGYDSTKVEPVSTQTRPQPTNNEDDVRKPTVQTKRPVSLFEKQTVPPIFDLETQGNTPRPIITRPTQPKQKPPNKNTVVGLSPPPKPLKYPQGPTVNIGGQRRPATNNYKNLTRPVAPYKFEIPPTTNSPEILTLSDANIKQNHQSTDDRYNYGVVQKPPYPQEENIKATTIRPSNLYRPKTVRPILASILSHEMKPPKQQPPTLTKIQQANVRPKPTSVTPVLQTVVGNRISSSSSVIPSLPRVPTKPSLHSQWDETIVGSETVYLDHVSHPTPVIDIVTNPVTISKPPIATTVKTVHSIDAIQTRKYYDSVKNTKLQPEISYSKTPKLPVELPTRYITHTKTLTVTTTETTVISSEGHRPSTRTVVLTKTQTSTIIDTVTQTHTLVKPTEIFATITNTVTASHYPSERPYDSVDYPEYPIKTKPEHALHETSNAVGATENEERKEEVKKTTPQRNSEDNDTFFVVVNDKKLSSVTVSTSNKNTLKEEEIASRDEADSNDEINRAVLLGGVLVAAPPPRHGIPSSPSSPTACRPDCSPARNELCQKVEGHMRCVCRPGFARMFPDRPCKPTYTYTLRLRLSRVGKEPLRYDGPLGDRSSPGFRHLSHATREGLDRLIMQSDLRDIYHGIAVDGFQPVTNKPRKPVLVSFHVQLSDNVDENRLKEVFKKSLRTNNMSLGGTDVFADKDYLQHLVAEDFDECTSPQFHDCSEHSHCFNLRGTYTCSCQEGYADLSENPLFPGRVCSAEVIGCDKCHYHGTCYTRDDQVLCQCFQWYSGETCHVNLKVLLIALVTIGTLLLGLLLVCAILTCTKRNRTRRPGTAAPGFLHYRGPSSTLDKRAMIADSSSEGSIDNGPVTFLAPTHASDSAMKGPCPRRMESVGYADQRDRSLTVMIPRAKYRPVPPTSPHLTMSTFGVEDHRRASNQEQKLLAYLEHGAQLAIQPTEQQQNMNQRENPNVIGRRKQSNMTTDGVEERPSAVRKSSPGQQSSPGALVSAGFQVSATVGRKEDSEPEVPAETHFAVTRTTERTVSEARSCDETTIQLPTKSFHGPSQYGSKPSSRNRDEAHTMAERDLGSTLLMPQTHLYRPDRGSDISNFDSL